MGQQVELIEPFNVPDTFVSGLGEVENLGNGLLRFSFYCVDHGQFVVVARLVAPRDAVPAALRMAARAVGTCACERLKEMALH